MSPKLIRDVVGLFWNQKVIAQEIYSIILDLHNDYSHCQHLLALVRDELKSWLAFLLLYVLINVCQSHFLFYLNNNAL